MDEFGEGIKETPFAVFSTITVGVAGERLTWSAADEYLEVIFRIKINKNLRRKIADIGGYELRSVVVRLEGVSTCSIVIDPGENTEAFNDEAVRKSSGSAEEIDDGNALHGEKSCPQCENIVLSDERPKQQKREVADAAPYSFCSCSLIIYCIMPSFTQKIEDFRRKNK